VRTKALLLGAAALAAGLMTSSAQVYSANIVGYVNVPLSTGFNLIANQLDADGTGTNNTVVSTLSTNVPAGSTLYKFANGGWTSTSFFVNRSGVGSWTDPTFTLNPGEGGFLYVPSAVTNTLVGTVLQGSLTNKYVNPSAGFAVVSSQFPIAGDISANLTYNGTAGDIIYTWDPVGQQYVSYSFFVNRSGVGSWAPSNPQLSVGQSFFLETATGGETWTNTLNVQ